MTAITLDVSHLWSLARTGAVTANDLDGRAVRLARPSRREDEEPGPASILTPLDVQILIGGNGKTMIPDHERPGEWLEIVFQPPPEQDEFKPGQIVIVDRAVIAQVDKVDAASRGALVEYPDDRSTEVLSWDRLS